MIKTSSPQHIPQQAPKALEMQTPVSLESLSKGGAPLTHQGVLQLQRTIGNQRAQRLIAARKPTALRIQRADAAAPEKTDEGLIGEDTSTRFAQKIYAITSNPQNARMKVSELLKDMAKALNEELTTIGMPAVTVVFEEAGGNRAWFMSKEWKVEVNADNVFGGADKCLGDLDSHTLTQAVGTIYHEGRHAEQDFRVAQLHAMELKRALVPANHIKTAMLKHLHMIYPLAIDQALAHPLDDQLDPALRAKILLWKDSMYSANTDYRDIVYSMKKEVLDGLRSNVEALIAFVPENYDTLPQDQRDPIVQQLMSIRVAIKTHGDRVAAYRNDKLQPEVDRLMALPIEVPRGNNSTMLNHLSSVINSVNSIERVIRLSPNPSIARRDSELINDQIDLIETELRAADFDLPEQADAVDAEHEVEKAFSDLLSQK